MSLQGIRPPRKRYLDSSERMVWDLDVSHVGSSTAEVSNPGMRITDLMNGRDVTASTTLGIMRIEGQKVIFKRIQNLTPGRQYLVEIFYTKGGSRFENNFELICSD